MSTRYGRNGAYLIARTQHVGSGVERGRPEAITLAGECDGRKRDVSMPRLFNRAGWGAAETYF